jgi:hypothetical protein
VSESFRLLTTIATSSPLRATPSLPPESFLLLGRWPLKSISYIFANTGR